MKSLEKYLKKKLGKRGAIELSMTTVIVVVLSLTLLIMGFVLIRNIMCGAVTLTQDINDRVKEQVNGLFGSTSGSEIACLGQGSEAISIFPDNENWIMCSIRAPESASYQFNLRVNDALTDKRVGSVLINRWLLTKENKFNVAPGDDDPRKITRFNIDSNAPEGQIAIDIEVTKSGLGSDNLVYSRTLSYQVTRKGAIRSIIC